MRIGSVMIQTRAKHGCGDYRANHRRGSPTSFQVLQCYPGEPLGSLLIVRARNRPHHRAMKALEAILCASRLWGETRGQDMIEYALMAGFMAVAAGAVLPDAGGDISTIFSRVTSVMTLITGPASSSG
jgi:pilus assembly protein Flp/PilA